MTKEQFYEECGRILGTTHEFKVSYAGRAFADRWNNRTPGNGRYPGIGVIQMFGTSCIHIAITSPQKLIATATSMEDAFALLRSIVGTGNKS